MRTHFLTFFLASVPVVAQIPGMDMAVMKKWSDAKVIKYQVVGAHNSRAHVVFGDYEGKADVTDKITLEFTWQVRGSQLIGDVKIMETKSELKNLKSDGTNCPPPTLSGDYEHFTVVKHAVTPGRAIQLDGVRTYPAAKVSNYPASCSMRSIPGGKENKIMQVTVIEPRLLGMPVPAGNTNMGVAADKKSFWMKAADNWVWTYTPEVVQ